MASSSQKDLFLSVISNIKSYTGDDPLRPWIQGIRKIHQSLPSHVLDEKLPRFLQKCVQTFESDRRYRNDSRYLAVWIQLMDYVEDAKVLFKKMENKQIGVKRAKFYIAYALYYEKKKRFEDAEKMYQLGVHNLAVPIGDLQKSYDQFLHRMKLLSHRRAKVGSMPNTAETTLSDGSSQKTSDLKNYQQAERYFQTDRAEKNPRRVIDKHLAQSHAISTKDLDRSAPFSKGDMGWPREDCSSHRGMFDPTNNTKEALNSVSSLFQVASEPEAIFKSLNQVKPRLYNHQCSIEVLSDEEIEESGEGNHSTANIQASGSPKKTDNTKMQKPFVGAFKILADDEDVDEDDDEHEDDDRDCIEVEEQIDGSHGSAETETRLHDVRLNEDTVIRRLKEDTVIRKFIGSTVFDEPKVEDACHHGLVDPTVNLKQAMDDINVMFGEPLNFVKAGKPKKQGKRFDRKPDSSNHGFFILADDDIEKDVKGQAPPPISHSSNGEGGFLEPTVFTKEAMDEINDLFGKPLDF